MQVMPKPRIAAFFASVRTLAAVSALALLFPFAAMAAAPTLATSGGSASFVAGDNTASTPVAVDPGLTVSDPDSPALASATIAITGNFHAGEDVLQFTNDGATMGNVMASYNASTGVMTLTSAGASATLAQWQAALRSVTYTDTAITPDTATRTVSFTVNDGTDNSTVAARTITVTATDQSPIVATTGGTTNYQGGTAAVTIDGGIAVSDLDNATQSSATVSIGTGFHSGDTLGYTNASGVLFGNIVASYNAATGVMTMTSAGATATDAQWSNALSSVTFSSTSTSYGNRTIVFAVNDGAKTSAAATDTVAVLGPLQIATDPGSTSFVAGDNTASTPVVIDAGLTVTGGGSTTLASTTIAITGGFHAGEDVLSFTNDGSTMGNIAASYNTATGVMTLTSAGATATLAQWQSALASVTYTDTAITPNTATRTVSFTAVDGGGATSNTATRTITVVATDQTPIVTTTGGTTDYLGGTAAVTIDGGITVSDLDNTTQSSATASVTTGFHAGDVLGFTNTSSAIFGNVAASYNAATGVMTLVSSGATATDAQWANALSSVTFSSTSTSYGNRTIAFAVNDGSRTSAVATDTVNLLGLSKVAIVSSTTADGSYKVGDTITLTVTFDQAVMVDTAGGSPTLLMETGGVDHAATYVSGSGSNTLNFVYTVQAGDTSADLDYASTAALVLNGGTIRSAGVVDAVLTLPATGGASSIAGQHAIVVDGIAPTVVSVTVPADGTYIAGQQLDFTVDYNEAVTVDTSGGTPRIAITLDVGGTAYADYVSGSSTTALVFRYTVAAGQADPNGIALAGTIDLDGGAIHDAVGNAEVDVLNGVAPTSGVLVGRADQAIAFGAQAPRTFVPNGTFALDPLATASSGLAASYTTQTASVCTIAGSTVTMLTAGTCTIAADQAGDASYNAAPTVTQSIAIGLGSQTITFGAQAPRTFVPNGIFTIDPLATASSGLAVSYSSQTTAVCTIAGGTVTMLTAGTCAIAADQAGDANYSPAPTVTQSIAIGAGSQSITFGAQSAQTFVPNGTFALDPSATASSGLAVSYGSQTTAVCTISGSTVTMLAAGTCTIAADQAGDTNYNAAPTVEQSITIGKAAQAITGFAANPAAPTFARNGTFGVSAIGGASGNPVLFASITGDVCSVSGSVVTMFAAGTCTLTADQAGNGNYSAAPQQVLDVSIARATPTLAWIDSLQKVVGEATFDLPDPGSDSSGAFTFTSSDPAVATVDGRAVTIVGPGTATLVATQAATHDYNQGTISTTLTVAARPDPTRDPDVVGTIQAQVDASVRFVAAQQNNIQGRLRQLRAGNGNPSSNRLALSYAGAGGGLALPLGSQASSKRLLPSGVWAAGTITIGRRDPFAGTGKLGFRSDGLTIGFDHGFGEHLVMGVAGGYGWSDTDSGDASTLDGRQRSLAAYGLWRGEDHGFVDGVVGVGNLDFDIARWSEVAATTARARRSGDQVFGALTFGYEHAGEHMTLTSYGRYDASRTTLDAYAESGLGIYDLRYGRQAVDDSGVALGIEGRHRFETASMGYRPYWLVEYRNALQSRSDVGINYVVQPVASDYVLGLRSSFDDALSVGVGLDMDLPRGWQLALQFRHEQAGSNRAESYGLQLTWGNPGAMLPQVAMQDPMQDPRAPDNLQPRQQP
jgi:hypothetical protein